MILLIALNGVPFYFSLKATEEIQDTANLHKGVEEDVMNASHKVDEVSCKLVF